jgi:hypothetical protein
LPFFVRAVLVAAAILALPLAGSVLYSTLSGPGVGALQERSDRFWSLLAVNGSPRSHFNSVEEMATAADVIAVGRITQVSAGREVRDLGAEALGKPREEASVFFADATVLVEEPIKGAPGTSIRLQLLLPTPHILGALQANLPTERGIYFLTDMGGYFAKEDPRSALSMTLAGTYDFVSPQGLLRDFGDRVGVTADESDSFLVDESRMSFSAALADTKRASSE